MTAQETTIRHDPQTPPADSITKRIFIGPNGLRAGWRLLIFMAIDNGNVDRSAIDHQALLPGRAGSGATDTYENHRAGSTCLLHLGGCGLDHEQD